MKRHLAIALLASLLGVSSAAPAQEIRPFPDELPDFRYYKGDPPRLLTLPDGKVLMPGFWSRGFAVVRVAGDGSVDRSFANNGIAELLLWGAGEYAPGPFLAPLADGRVLVGGNARDGMNVPGCDYVYKDCNVHIAVFRLDAQGRQDMSYNGYGRLVLRVGPPTGEPFEDNADRFVTGLQPLSDGTALVMSQSIVTARVLADGRLDGSSYPAHEHDFIAAVPFYDAALAQFFATADLSEMAMMDRAREGGDAGWQSQGDGWFHVYPPGWTATPTAPVCRFYGAPEAGFDSHILSANAEECVALEADGRWILESREVFRVGLPDPVTGACADSRAPVYRLWNGRRDSGHALTTSRHLRDYLLAQGHVAEGWGPLGVAMCAAP